MYDRPAPALAVMHAAGTVADAVALVTETVTVTLCDTLLAVSVPVTVSVALPVGVAVPVWTVKLAPPEPPVMVGLSRLAVTLELLDETVSETVPVKEFNACTVTVNTTLAPAVTLCVVGLAVRENSELLPLPVLPPTILLGEITHPFTAMNKTMKKNDNKKNNNLRMKVPSFYSEVPHDFFLQQAVASNWRTVIGFTDVVLLFASICKS